MGMPIIQLSVFEALTEAGVKPEAARTVEREIENAIQVGQEAVRAEMRSDLMTKPDGMAMESRLKELVATKFNEQLRWIITTQIAVTGAAIAAIKLLLL